MANWPKNYTVQNFKQFFLPPPKISTMLRASFPPQDGRPHLQDSVQTVTICIVNNLQFQVWISVSKMHTAVLLKQRRLKGWDFDVVALCKVVG